MKTLYIVAGANGSGKTTFAMNFAQLQNYFAQLQNLKFISCKK